MYAPTVAAPCGVRLQFRHDLEDVIDTVPQDELLVLLEGFNTRIGLLGPDEDLERVLWGDMV